MKRLFACACIAVGLAVVGCGNDESSAPTPQPAATASPAGGILAPADQADEVVADLNSRTNDLQQRPNLDQRTGGGYGSE